MNSRSCHFDDDLAPGATYGTTLPYRVGEDAYAPGSEFGETNWMTPAEFEDFDAYLDSAGVTVGKPGTDGKLSLTKLSTEAGARSFQADTEPENNWSSLVVKVTGKNGTDLEAIGDTASGEEGDKVVVTVGFRNNGPATLGPQPRGLGCHPHERGDPEEHHRRGGSGVLLPDQG